MKDLIEIMERVERGLSADGESDEDIKRHDRWRVKHSAWLHRQELRERQSDRECPPYQQAYARVDRDLVAQGIVYLPQWLAWRMCGCRGLTRRQTERWMEKYKDADHFKAHMAELLPEALDLLMGRTVLAP